jgi:hypothetical protein
MMIRRKNVMMVTDPSRIGSFQKVVDYCWGAHSYRRLWGTHNNMVGTGCSVKNRDVETLWFPDPPEAAFFRDAMRLVRGQAQDDKDITYEDLCALFKEHVRLAEGAKDSTVTSN